MGVYMDFCNKTASVWSLVGKFFFILKIIIPLLIIILAIFELSKSIMGGDSSKISKSVGVLAKKLIAGIIIFFIPTLVKVAFDLVAGFNDEIKKDYGNCFTCLTDPYGKCDTSYKGEIFTK